MSRNQPGVSPETSPTAGPNQRRTNPPRPLPGGAGSKEKVGPIQSDTASQSSGAMFLQRVHAQQAVEPAPQILGSREVLQSEDRGRDTRCLRRAWASMPADWSTPVTRKPAASSTGQYLPVPQAASRTSPPGRINVITRVTNAACDGLIAPSSRRSAGYAACRTGTRRPGAVR